MSLPIDRGSLARAARLAPAVLPVAVLSAAALVVTVLGGMGVGPGLTGGPTTDAYRAVLGHPGFSTALCFTVAVATAGTCLAVLGGLAIGFGWCAASASPGRGRRRALRVLQLNLALPHVVWAVALLATFSASGWLARVSAAVGLIDRPAQFPTLVQDRWGLGIIGHLVTKEVPFVALAVLPLSGTATRDRLQQAAVLGASAAQRFRLVYLPAVAPAAVPAGLASFAFSLGAYEPAAVLGVANPRALAVVALERFRSPDPARRAEGFAIATMLLVIVVAAAVVAWVPTRRLLTRPAGDR